MPLAAKTKKSGRRANSKKAAPSSETIASLTGAASTSNEGPLFEIDTVGSSTVRHALLANQAPGAARLRKGTSFNKPLKSDQILAARSSAPALSSRVVPSTEAQRKRTKEKLAKVDRATKERLKRIAGRDGQGQGLWGVSSGGDRPEMITEAIKAAGTFDAWSEPSKPDAAEQDQAMEDVLKVHKKQQVKVPTTLHSHQLLGKGDGPRSVPLPHPGMSYNPAHTEHQELLGEALDAFETLEERDERGEKIKSAMDGARKAAQGKEAWELYEDEVGSGEEDESLMIVDPSAKDAKKKPTKRKTQKQRNAKLRLRDETQDIERRRAAKKRIASVAAAPTITAAIKQAEEMSLAEKAAALKMQKVRLASQGLTRFRSGPSRVPEAPVTFQLGDELAENLRTLKPEGNLWRDWVGSNMRRGRVPVERANESKKGGKRGRGHDKNHKMREVEKYSYKNWTG